MEHQNDSVKLAKVSLFIRERPHSTKPRQHLLISSPISITHPKSYPPQDQSTKRVHKHHREQRAEQPITTIFDEFKSIKINNPKTFQSPRQEQKQFNFHKIFPHHATQSTMFDQVGRPIVNHTLNGYNACCFAYGQTGSGKTYTIFGDNSKLRRGLLPRSIDYLFQHLHVAPSTKPSKSALEMIAKKHSKLSNHCKSSKSSKSSKMSLSVDCGPQSADFSVIPTFFNILKDKGINPEFAAPDDKYCVVVSFLEIYLDRIRDLGISYLLQKGYQPKQNSTSSVPPMNSPRNYTRHPFDGLEKMEIHEDINGQVFVKGLHHIPIKSAKEAMDVIQCGLRKRQSAETSMNDVSSRSHSIFTISILQKSYSYTQDLENGIDTANGMNAKSYGNAKSDISDTETWSFDITDTDTYLPYGYQLYGKMHFIDLAGSERLDRSGSQGIRMMEAVNINQSLTALGKVVISLSNPDEYSHIPFRDSKLTRILQNSLRGNCKTTVLATINPYKLNYEETLQTLLFAHRCTNVSTRIHCNTLDHKDRMQKLQKRIQLLLRELASLKDGYAVNENTMISPKSIRKFLFNKQPEIAQDLGGLVQAANSLLTNPTDKQRQSVSFKSDSSSQNYKHLMNQMNVSFTNPAAANMGGVGGMMSATMNSAFSNFDFGKLRDLEVENEELQRTIQGLHDHLNQQDESYHSQTNSLRKKVADLKSKLESKDQSLKHTEATLKEAMEKQSENLLAANQRSIESILMTLLKTPSFSLRGKIRRLLNQHKCGDTELGETDDIQNGDSKSEDTDDSWTMTGDHEAMHRDKVHIPRKKFDAFCSKMEREKKEEINTLKRKYCETLNYKTKRIGILKKEMECLHKEHEEQHKKLQKEFKFLYKCLGNLTGIIESVENGRYTVHITSGIKTIQLPKSEDTESTRSTMKRCATLRQLLHQSDSFIDRQSMSDGIISDDGEPEDYQQDVVIHNNGGIHDEDRFGIDDIAEEISEVESNISIPDSFRDDSPDIMSPLQSARQDPRKYYQKQAVDTRNALNSLRIAFESQKRQLGNQDERIRNLMISRSNSLSNTFHQTRSFRKLPSSHRDYSGSAKRTPRSLSRSASRSRPSSAVTRRKPRPNSAQVSMSSLHSNDISERRRSRPNSAHRPRSAKSDVVRLPFNKISNNRILTRFNK